MNFVERVGTEFLASHPGIAASTEFPCHAGSVTFSPVPAAMGVPPEAGMGADRLSLGRTATREELEQVLRLLQEYPS